MSIEETLKKRSNNSCELCTSTEPLTVYTVEPTEKATDTPETLLCNSCLSNINTPENIDINHWRCLNDSMWSQVPAVQVAAWRLLSKLSAEPWAQDLLDMLYFEDDTMQWAKALEQDEALSVVQKDSNGAILSAGDTVTLVKDLPVKGAGFTAKRGTAVRGISLTDNPEHIEGRVNGTRIVILTQYVKKSN